VDKTQFNYASFLDFHSGIFEESNLPRYESAFQPRRPEIKTYYFVFHRKFPIVLITSVEFTHVVGLSAVLT